MLAFLASRTIAVVGALALSTAAFAQSTKNNPAATLKDQDAGLIYFKSANVFGPRQMIARQYEGEVTIKGELKFPDGATGPVAAVVIMHGSGGVLKSDQWLADELRKAGYATFVVDSFEPRGVASTVFDQTAVTTGTMVKDVYQALKLLSTHPRIDKARIALVGASKGGLASFMAAFEPIRKALADGDQRFAAHGVLYTSCLVQFKNPVATGAPILFQLGKLDAWTLPEGCTKYAKKLEQAGKPIKLIIYDDAYHGWGPGNRKMEVMNFSKCLFEVNDDGSAFDAHTRKPVDSRDQVREAARSCAKRQTVTIGAKSDTVRPQALKDLTSFLAANLTRR